MKIKLPILIAFYMLAKPALAFMTVQESNEITPKGQFKIAFEPQARLSEGSGFNFAGFFDAPINEEMSARVHLGSGETDFFGGGSFKWVPVPDYGRQPSVGGKFSLIHWREADHTFFTFRIDPIVSKKFQVNSSTFIPYLALPIMFNNGNEMNKTTVQLAVGSEFWHPDADNMTFGAELGLDAKDSFSYISGYVTIFLEDQR